MSSKIHLPVDDFLNEICQQSSKGNLVITAAPGAGKTTRLPPALLNTCQGKVLVLEPRRMAAIAAAHRIAEENNWQLGHDVGYQVRFANKTNSNTRLIFMTEALLARQMIHDPELQGVDVIVLDEFHERSLHVDLTLGLLRELQELGRNIRLVVMSATLEAEKISTYLGNAAVISIPGKLFELTIQYQKNNQLLQLHHSFYENLFSTIKEAHAKTDKDILVFLPGVGEIERVQSTIQDWADSKYILIQTLHGSLPLEEQKKALQKQSQQRVILSTNIAESSVTIDGVNTVIDTGLAKVMRQDHKTGFQRLELSRISLSSAIQRSGRAARQYPGMCYRMWNKHDELSFSKSESAEVTRADLTESLLFLAAQGVSDFKSFLWFESPSNQSIDRAIQILKSAEALDSKNQITLMGRKILHYPLPVRLARMVIAGQEHQCSELAAKLAALLQERDVMKKDSLQHYVAEKFECDLQARLEIFEHFLSKKTAKEGHSISLQNAAQSYQQILNLSKEHHDTKTSSRDSTSTLEAKNILLLAAYSDRLCRRRKDTERALMVGGRGVKLATESLVRKSEFFFALNGVEGSSESETQISLASGIDKDILFKNVQSKITKNKDIVYNEEKGQFFKNEFKCYLGLPLEEPSLTPASPDDIALMLPQVMVQNFPSVLKKHAELASLIERIQFLNANKSALSTELQGNLEKVITGGELLPEFIKNAFEDACIGHQRFDDVLAQDLVYFFSAHLPESIKLILDKELPAKLKVPSGSMIRVQYPIDKAPFIEVRIQEVFGLQETPKVMFQKIPIVMHLLGPNFRPVQITNDLKSFWQNGYPEVRKELRIKYPKHQWPEDPADGIAEAKGRRRH